jgi:hypothetical protein
MSDALILIDVDGVLNPWQRQGPQWEKHRAVADGTTWNVILNPDHGPMLLTLASETGADLVWATTWDHDANREIGPRIGLPELPVIEVRTHPGEPGVHPKTPPVAEYVARRPDRDYLKGHPGVGDFLIVDVGPRVGLTPKHLEKAAEWLAARSTPKET